MSGSFLGYPDKSVLDCLQPFHLRRVDVLENGIAVIEFGMSN